MLLQKIRNAYFRLTGRAIVPPDLKIGARVHVGENVHFDWSHAHHITIEDDVTLAAECRILAHDAASYRRTGLTWVSPVVIGRGSFIGARALIMPGVVVGEHAVVAAGSVVTSDVPAGSVVAGCPARQLSTTAALDAKRLALAARTPIYAESVYNKHPLSMDVITELRLSGTEDGYFLARVPGFDRRGVVALEDVEPLSAVSPNAGGQEPRS